MSKPDWIYRQSAVVPFLQEAGQLKLVLITSNSAKHWIIPKGIIERGMTPQASAAKEAMEEAGVLGTVSDELISEYEYDKWGGTCHVQVFPLEVTEVLDSWDEQDHRERKCLTPTEALSVAKEIVKPVLEDFLAWHANSGSHGASADPAS